MHAGAVDGQSAFTAEGVIDGEEQGAGGTKNARDEQGQAHVEKIEIPGGVAEEAMKASPMALGDIAARKDDVGDVTMPMGEDPAGADLGEGPESRLGKSGAEMG